MKPAAYILTIMMLFLTVQPILANCQARMRQPLTAAGCGGGGCSKKEASKKPDTKDCERSTGCNPFASCSQCQYIISKLIYPGTLLSIPKPDLLLISEDIESGFISDCWHPPRNGSC